MQLGSPARRPAKRFVVARRRDFEDLTPDFDREDGMKVYAAEGEETFDGIQPTEKAPAGADRREAA